MKKAVSILLAFLLTGALICFCLTLIGRQVIIPAMGENGAQVSSDVVREEKRLILERIGNLAELYGFNAEPVAALVDDETLQDLNRQASRWWSSILKDGRPGLAITWDTEELERLLGTENETGYGDESADPVSVADAVRKSVVRVVLPMRQQVIQLGMQEAEERVDVPNLVNFFLGTPWAALALCALLSGLLVLLESRKPGRSLRWIGSAMGGAALVLAAVAALVLCAGIRPMILEASESLEILYSNVQRGSMILAGVLAAVMAAGCVLCLVKGRRAA